MTDVAQNSPRIQIIDAGLRKPALQLLWQRLPAGTRRKLIASLDAESKTQGPDFWRGLVGAFRDDRLVGAAWTQWQPGRSTMVHGPQLCHGEPHETATLLAAKLVELATHRDVRVAQALHEVDDQVAAQALAAAGFEHVAELQYLFCDTRSVPAQLPQASLTFEPYSPALHDRFAQVVGQTYERSLDCPRAEGLRTVEESLTTYRATGVFNPNYWLLVSEGTNEVGCLLLADHPTSDQSELVYMGVIPEHRGKSRGLQIVRHAAWLAKCAKRARLVAAADSANRPAIAMYHAAGFVSWDRRNVFLRVFHATCASDKSPSESP